MTKKKPPGSQEWMKYRTDTLEDPKMYKTPPGDYDLSVAQDDPDIAKIYFQYIAEDGGLGKKLSPKAEAYLAHCLRRIADGEVSVFKRMGQICGQAKRVFCSSFSYYAACR